MGWRPGPNKGGDLLKNRRGRGPTPSEALPASPPSRPGPTRQPAEYRISETTFPPDLQNEVREFLKHCQCAWIPEQRFERGRDLLYEVTRPLRWMVEHQGLKEIGDLTPQVWFAWLDQRLVEGLKPVTVNSDLCILRHLVYFLREAGHEVCERFLLVEPLRAGWRMPKDVPLEQLRRLQAVIQAQANSSHAGYRRIGRLDLAWFLLMLHCGLLTCEVRHLKMGDIEWDAHSPLPAEPKVCPIGW